MDSALSGFENQQKIVFFMYIGDKKGFEFWLPTWGSMMCRLLLGLHKSILVLSKIHSIDSFYKVLYEQSHDYLSIHL